MNIEYDSEQRIARSTTMVSRKIAGEFILVPIRQTAGEIDSIFAFNEVAGRIWELLDGTRCVRDICDVITSEFDVEPEEAKRDVIEFLQQLDQINAIGAV